MPKVAIANISSDIVFLPPPVSMSLRNGKSAVVVLTEQAYNAFIATRDVVRLRRVNKLSINILPDGSIVEPAQPDPPPPPKNALKALKETPPVKPSEKKVVKPQASTLTPAEKTKAMEKAEPSADVDAEADEPEVEEPKVGADKPASTKKKKKKQG